MRYNKLLPIIMILSIIGSVGALVVNIPNNNSVKGYDCGAGNCVQSTIGGYVCVPCSSSGGGSGNFWNISNNQVGLTGNKTGSFDLITTGNILTSNRLYSPVIYGQTTITPLADVPSILASSRILIADSGGSSTPMLTWSTAGTLNAYGNNITTTGYYVGNGTRLTDVCLSNGTGCLASGGGNFWNLTNDQVGITGNKSGSFYINTTSFGMFNNSVYTPKIYADVNRGNAIGSGNTFQIYLSGNYSSVWTDGVQRLILTSINDTGFSQYALEPSQISASVNNPMDIGINVGVGGLQKTFRNLYLSGNGTMANIFAGNICYSNGTGCTTGGNSSWNETYANGLYYPYKTNPYGYYNVTTLPNITKLYDNSNVLSISGNDRKTKNSAGNSTIDYQNLQLMHSDSKVDLDWDTHTLFGSWIVGTGITAPNICYSNGTGCMSSGSMNYTNITMLNKSNTFVNGLTQDLNNNTIKNLNFLSQTNKIDLVRSYQDINTGGLGGGEQFDYPDGTRDTYSGTSAKNQTYSYNVNYVMMNGNPQSSGQNPIFFPMNYPLQDDINLPNGWTVSMWVVAPVRGNCALSGTLLSTYCLGGNNNIDNLLRMSDDNYGSGCGYLLAGGYNGAYGGLIAGSPTIVAGQYHHIVFGVGSWATSGMNNYAFLYYDNTFIGYDTNTMWGVCSNPQWELGGTPNAWGDSDSYINSINGINRYTDDYSGSITNVQFYNYELDSTAVNNIYNAGYKGDVPNGLKSYLIYGNSKVCIDKYGNTFRQGMNGVWC